MIRFAEERDAKRLAEISEANVEPSWKKEDFIGAIINPQAVVLLAEETDITGYAVCYFAADEGEIPSIAVEKSYRRNGIGRALFEALSSYIIKKDIARLFLEVREGNEAAVSFYYANGFTNVGRRKNFYRNPTEDALILEKQFS